MTFGTETDTSIIGPASINGVVGVKPTVGFTSRNGVIPISENMDTVGPFGRTVADAVHGLNAIMGIDERDHFTCSPSRRLAVDYSKCLTTKESLKGARFGLPNKRCWELVQEDRKTIASKIFEAIREAGGEVLTTDFPCAEERIPPDGSWDWLDHSIFKDVQSTKYIRTYGEPSQSEFTVVKVDAYNGINAYLSELSDTCIKSVEDIIQYVEKNSGTEGAYPGDHQAFPSGLVKSDVTYKGSTNGLIRTIFEKFAVHEARGTRLTCELWSTHRQSPAQRVSTPR